jgi:hypothetical protein
MYYGFAIGSDSFCSEEILKEQRDLLLRKGTTSVVPQMPPKW